MAPKKKASKKSPKDGDHKIAATSNRAINERLANAKKIGERTESITELLSPSQVEAERANVCTLHRDLDRVEGDLKTISAGHKARIKEIKAGIATSVAIANAAKRDVEIIVEEWLTGRNEVIRIRKDTREVLGNRIAKMDELQEEMFDDDDPSEDDHEDLVENGAPQPPQPDEHGRVGAEPADGDFGNGEATA